MKDEVVFTILIDFLVNQIGFTFEKAFIWVSAVAYYEQGLISEEEYSTLFMKA